MPETSQTKRPARKARSRSKGRGKGPNRIVALPKRSSSHFRPAVRDRGSDHFEQGHVQLEIEGTRARASVDCGDGERFAVGVDWTQVPEKRALHTFCECPNYLSGEKCEHIWATLLAVTDANPESQPPGVDRLSVRRDRPAAWPDLGISPTAAAANVVEDAPRPRRRRTRARRTVANPRQASPTTWRSQFETLREAGEPAVSRSTSTKTAPVLFLVNTKETRGTGGLVLDLFHRREGRAGRPGQFRRARVDPADLPQMLLPGSNGTEGQRRSVEVVTALDNEPTGRGSAKRRSKKKSTGIQRFRVPRRLYESILEHLSTQSLLGWWDGHRPSGGQMLSWDTGPSWHLNLRLEETSSDAIRLVGSLERNGDSVPLTDPVLILPTGESTRPLILFADSISHLEGEGDLRWINQLRETHQIVIPGKDLDEAFSEMFEIPYLPRLEIPKELGLTEETSTPQPRLVLKSDNESRLNDSSLVAELFFRYGDLEVSAGDGRSAIVDRSRRSLLRRDMAEEHKAVVRLLEAGAKPLAGGHGSGLEVSAQEVPAVVEPLLAEGWEIELQGTNLRSASPTSLRIESGIDWFEISGDVDFAGDEVDLKALLEAVSQGQHFVELSDGTQGLIPASLSETLDSLSDLAQGTDEDGLRFFSSQALLVDALLSSMPAPAVDKAFAELRDKLRSFEEITPLKEPRGFRGTLRGYQREGLGWLEFLREYGLGGILADDMGLGKTIQVLALLKANRTPTKSSGLPSLVVVPRSLLYNWVEEASRFTPSLKVKEYGGPGREKLHSKLGKYDMVVTTYGTMRRDIGFLSTVEFDTVILDEAQAIKNRDSQTAKASRLLVARHRLALTGTPIENHLGELGSIFEYLNPGLTGRLPMLEVLNSGRNASKTELERVAEGIRPFILRRTKAEVLPDLPPKTEQVLHTGLTERQRELYDQLRAGYQASLLKKVETEGLGSKSIEVLEALLRLRQIACHPALVNEEWEEAGSAKIDALFDLVTEVLDEGHKVLVFSQFTKLLGLVRRRFEGLGMEYSYLDGQTRNRAEVVERFQSDPACNIFLVSLKAGGVGLNLTAADYVFLLDPWWNPAVEAQAIDRAHRIGQDKPVFAYKMIAEDTVEEKILELQASKRQIADAILEGDGGPLSELTADDLRVLLS